MVVGKVKVKMWEGGATVEAAKIKLLHNPHPRTHAHGWHNVERKPSLDVV